LITEERMSEAISTERTRLNWAADALLSPGRAVFALAIIALGIETLVCARILPAIPWLAYMFGPVLAACGAGLLFKRTLRTAAIALGSLLVLCTLVLEVPKYAAIPGSMSLRTVVFEPLAIGVLAWLLPGRNATPSLLARASRYLLAISFIVFGVDHFLALAPIGTLVPNWIPWHVFWIAFFGAGFIAAGLSIGFNFLARWGAACIGLMYAIWVFTLHLPRVLGLYGIPGAPRSPDEWSSLLIAVALWGGSWALAGVQSYPDHHRQPRMMLGPRSKLRDAS
jgi:hypothetical protein